MIIFVPNGIEYSKVYIFELNGGRALVGVDTWAPLAFQSNLSAGCTAGKWLPKAIWVAEVRNCGDGWHLQ